MSMMGQSAVSFKRLIQSRNQKSKPTLTPRLRLFLRNIPSLTSKIHVISTNPFRWLRKLFTYRALEPHFPYLLVRYLITFYASTQNQRIKQSSTHSSSVLKTSHLIVSCISSSSASKGTQWTKNVPLL